MNGESVEENANLVIRLLIRRPECLGPALRGEGEGLLKAIVDANKMSERIADRRKLMQMEQEGDVNVSAIFVTLFDREVSMILLPLKPYLIGIPKGLALNVSIVLEYILKSLYLSICVI